MVQFSLSDFFSFTISKSNLPLSPLFLMWKSIFFSFPISKSNLPLSPLFFYVKIYFWLYFPNLVFFLFEVFSNLSLFLFSFSVSYFNCICRFFFYLNMFFICFFSYLPLLLLIYLFLFFLWFSDVSFPYLPLLLLSIYSFFFSDSYLSILFFSDQFSWTVAV